MSDFNLALLMVRLRLTLTRRGPVAPAAALLCIGGAAAWLWYAPQARTQRALDQHPVPAIVIPVASLLPSAAPPTADQNLARFYDALGERRDAEQQLKTLFATAGKAGLVLSAGQYKAGYDKNAQVHTYQIVLPVKGSYRAVWQFCLQALGEIPFASLDELNFRRDAIGDATVEARLRFTLYLKERGVQP